MSASDFAPRSSISSAEPGWICADCGAAIGFRWVVIDLVERPDLRAAVSSGEVFRRECPHCGAASVRTTPIFVLQMSESLPLVLAVPTDEIGMHANPMESARSVIEPTRTRMGDRADALPGPIIVVEYEVLALAASRDVDADLADPAGASSRGAIPAELAVAYEDLVAKLEQIRPRQRMLTAFYLLRSARSPGDLAALDAAYPELHSPDADGYLARLHSDAADDFSRAFAIAQREMVSIMADGDFERAFLHLGTRAAELLDEDIPARLEALHEQAIAYEEAGNYEGCVATGEEIISLAETLDWSGLKGSDFRGCCCLVPGNHRTRARRSD